MAVQQHASLFIQQELAYFEYDTAHMLGRWPDVCPRTPLVSEQVSECYTANFALNSERLLHFAESVLHKLDHYECRRRCQISAKSILSALQGSHSQI